MRYLVTTIILLFTLGIANAQQIVDALLSRRLDSQGVGAQNSIVKARDHLRRRG